ncbi:hypothetical protein DFH06DRAFT_1272202 [Mycena polygramma]|nr:hypothetical protein DFH06DRAFT_1272202 [Mycena polygramma]
MEPTAYDIRREVEALRDLRRRSTNPGALTLDPDLPNQSPPSPRSPEAGSSSSRPPDPAPAAQQPSDDPFHLFWVPASLHPEIAPAEFRAFLKEHARNPSSDDDPANLARSASNASTTPSGLGRKKSMLSRQYEPSENDANDESSVVPLRRNRSIFSSNQNQGPQLTISDLQKLEELAEEASTSDDPAKLRNILRRSLSLNLSPLALDDADLGDEADQPIVVAPPGQFLRRTARTRIRKPGLPGDGNGHRFGERLRGPSARSATSPMLNRTSSDVSSSDHGESVESATLRHRTTFSDDGPHERPDSFSEEALIYDAYARDEEDDIPPPLPPVLITSSPPPTIIEFTDIPPQPEAPPQQEPPPPPPPEPQPTLLEALSPVIYQPQPTRLLSPAPADTPAPLSRTPSPSDSQPDTYSPSGTLTNSPPSSSFLSTSPSPRKEKDKKGLFGKWGSDKEKEKSHKAGKKERERLEKERREKEQREKDSGFFGSLFGSKKKHEAPPETSSSQGGREAAQALLGPSQRAPKSPGPPSPGMGGMPGMMGGAGGVNNYSRYPIHVERAIYRLSHIKLANPRRPLYEQVLISNLMFWYLGVINKAQAGAQAEQAAQAAAAAQPAGGANGQAPGPPEGEKERLERERVEREAAAAAQERAEQERVERERVEREREREQRERAEREQWEQEKKKRDASPRRGALTKAVPPGAPQQRRAEMPVKGPQYEMQHRSMEKEYAGYNGNGPIRSSTASGSGQMYPRQQQSPTSPKFNQQPASPQPQDQHYYYSPGEAMQQQQQRLPPGAMPPVDSSTWVVGQPPMRKHANSSPPPMSNQVAPHRRSRSPPPPTMNQQPMPVYNPDGAQGGARLGGRSLSATAVPSAPPPPMNGKIRKGQSAYAGGAPANGRRSSPANGAGAGGGGEEEDVPLAVWQRQQQRR